MWQYLNVINVTTIMLKIFFLEIWSLINRIFQCENHYKQGTNFK